MKSHLYLPEKTREKMKSQLSDMGQLYFERIEPLFSSAEEEADQYTKQLHYEIGASINWGGDNAPDPEGYEEMVWEAGIARYELLDSMRYRTICMWICCLCQTWEQQLYSWIIHEARMEGITYDDKYLAGGFSFVSDVLECHEVDYKTVKAGKIEELRLLVNVLKHGKGRSEKALRDIRPNLFIRNGHDVMRYHNSTLIEPTLSVSNQDFRDYLDALLTFWSEFPENAYSQYDVPLAESEESE